VASSADYASGKCALSFPFRLTSLLIFNAYAGDLVMQCNVALFGQNVHDEINKKKISSEPQPQAE